jgi:hypothetical protein
MSSSPVVLAPTTICWHLFAPSHASRGLEAGAIHRSMQRKTLEANRKGTYGNQGETSNIVIFSFFTLIFLSLLQRTDVQA